MPPTLSEFRAISSGTHNVGDVLLDTEKGGLKKVNNFVSRWRVERNKTIASTQENIAVRKALYDALLVDGRVSKPVMDAIKNQLLGENGVRALKRDEVAVYIAAADADDARGLNERITELRNRAISRGDGVDRPLALKSKRDVAMELSANEKLDMARVSLQRARIDIERYMAAKKVGGASDGFLDDFYRDFSDAFKGLALLNVTDARKRQEWGRVLEFHTDMIRAKIANGTMPCENHDQVPDLLGWYLDMVGLDKYSDRKLDRVKDQLMAAFGNNIEELAPSTVDAIRETALVLGEELTIPEDDAAEEPADNAAGSVAGRHFESASPRLVVAESMKFFLGAVVRQIKDEAFREPKFVGYGTAQKSRELMLRFHRHIKKDMAVEKVSAGECTCVQALANAAGRHGKAFGGNVIPECEHSLEGYDYRADFSSGRPDPTDGSCSFTLNFKVPVNAVGVGGKDYELTPDCKRQTSVEYAITFRLGFDEKLEPQICVDKSVEKVDMPDVVDGERYEDETNAAGAFAGSRKVELHLEASPEELIEAAPAREQARPSSYRNVMDGMRELCRAARHVYTSTLSNRKSGETPNPALVGELYMEMGAFDGVKDLDADCPGAKKMLDKGFDRLAGRLVRVFKRHGVVMDLATARYAMKIHLDGIKKGIRS